MRCSLESYLPINTKKTPWFLLGRARHCLNALLDAPKKKLLSLVVLPLKRLQVTRESDFNTRYGIPTVVINEDTPREDAWWTACSFFFVVAVTPALITLCRKTSGIAGIELLGPPDS